MKRGKTVKVGTVGGGGGGVSGGVNTLGILNASMANAHKSY